MATIYDVAKEAGVSVATVSRVFSNPAIVSAETLKRVRAATKALRYEPNAAAKSLRTSKVSKMLVTVPDITNLFFSNIIHGAEKAASLLGYSLVLGNIGDDPERARQYATMLKRHEVDGLIFLGHEVPDTLEDLLRTNEFAPIVNGCEYSPGLSVSSVHIDNRSAAACAMDHLYGLGHRHVGIITGPLSSPLSQDRLAGVRSAADKGGAAQHLQVEHGDFTIESGRAAIRRLLASADRPSALFFFSDEMAMGGIAECRAAGLNCPDDISIVGFDDIRFAQHTQPPLTTISQPAEAIGRECVKLLYAILSGEVDLRRSIILPYAFIERGSTAAAKIPSVDQ